MNYSLYELTVDDTQSLGMLVCCFLSSSNGMTHFFHKMRPSAVHPGLVITAENSHLDQFNRIGCRGAELK